MIFLSLASVLTLLTPPLPTSAGSFSVNRIIGDLSFKEKYGSSPSQTSAEALRIQTHLEYAELLIRRQTEITCNNSSRKLASLSHLNHYWKRGEFPQHNISLGVNDYRRPRFIDHRDVHCAVGYLILKSDGFEKLPNEINVQNEYSYVDEIRHVNLKKWMNLYGYTIEELKLIQPTYSDEYFRKRTLISVTTSNKSQLSNSRSCAN